MSHNMISHRESPPSFTWHDVKEEQPIHDQDTLVEKYFKRICFINILLLLPGAPELHGLHASS